MTHVPLPPFAATAGPRRARVVFVGEAWGESEDRHKKPLAGASGKELHTLLGKTMDTTPDKHAFLAQCHGRMFIDSREEWLASHGFLFTNVMALRPKGNNFDLLCCKASEIEDRPVYNALAASYGLNPSKPHLSQGKFLQEQYFCELERLREELREASPNLVVALGAKAAWALLGAGNIGAIRGTVAPCTLVPGLKVLPTYHPAAIFRQYSFRPIVMADLMKAAREQEFPDIRRPKRWVLVDPTLEEIDEWMGEHLPKAHQLGVDVETGRNMIKCVGFATSPEHAMVIPFFDPRLPTGSYWPTLDLHRAARQRVQRILASPIPKVFQNGLYDIQYFLREQYILRNCEHDTMLRHHSLYPELQKGLGFMGSLYTNESSWKLLRGKSEELKRDE